MHLLYAYMREIRCTYKYTHIYICIPDRHVKSIQKVIVPILTLVRIFMRRNSSGSEFLPQIFLSPPNGPDSDSEFLNTYNIITVEWP
jgi:hypothetical protein